MLFFVKGALFHKKSKFSIISNILMKSGTFPSPVLKCLSTLSFSWYSWGGIYWNFDNLLETHIFHEKCDFHSMIGLLVEKLILWKMWFPGFLPKIHQFDLGFYNVSCKIPEMQFYWWTFKDFHFTCNIFVRMIIFMQKIQGVWRKNFSFFWTWG